MAVPRAYDHQQLRQRMGNLEQQQQQTLSEPSQASTNSLQESSVMESFSSDPTNAAHTKNTGQYFIYVEPIQGDARRSGPFLTASEAKEEFEDIFPEFVGGSVWMTKVTSPFPEITPEELLRFADREEDRFFWGKTLEEVEETPWQDILDKHETVVAKIVWQKDGATLYNRGREYDPSFLKDLAQQPSQSLAPDLPNAFGEAELLRAEQLSFQYHSQLAFYAQAKAQQIQTLQASLQTAIHSQTAKLAAIEAKRLAWPAGRQARTALRNQIAQAKARLAQLERRSERVGDIAQTAGLYADSLLDELAARKLRFHHADLARQWDALQQQQRKAALQNLQSNQSVEIDQGRTRSLSFSSES